MDFKKIFHIGHHDLKKGIPLILLAWVCFSTLYMMSKLLSDLTTTSTMLFFFLWGRREERRTIVLRKFAIRNPAAQFRFPFFHRQKNHSNVACNVYSLLFVQCSRRRDPAIFVLVSRVPISGSVLRHLGRKRRGVRLGQFGVRQPPARLECSDGREEATQDDQHEEHDAQDHDHSLTRHGARELSAPR